MTICSAGQNSPPARVLDVPPSVDRVGWYRFGPGMSADQGSIVIAGHVDSAEQGKGDALQRISRVAASPCRNCSQRASWADRLRRELRERFNEIAPTKFQVPQ